MNVENGNIMTVEAMKALHGESVFDALKSQGKVIPVDLEDMTPEQLERFNNGEQPVVKEKDYKSELAKLQQKQLKRLAQKDREQLQNKKDVSHRREKNKSAKKARKKNR